MVCDNLGLIKKNNDKYENDDNDIEDIDIQMTNLNMDIDIQMAVNTSTQVNKQIITQDRAYIPDSYAQQMQQENMKRNKERQAKLQTYNEPTVDLEDWPSEDDEDDDLFETF